MVSEESNAASPSLAGFTYRPSLRTTLSNTLNVLKSSTHAVGLRSSLWRIGPPLCSGVCDSTQMRACVSYSGLTSFTDSTPAATDSTSTPKISHLYRRMAEMGRSSAERCGASVGTLPHPSDMGG